MTRAILAGFNPDTIKHLAHPPGGTYITNIQTLINQCQTPWLSILHDDDFFVENPPALLIHLKDPSVDFIFSDHWIATADGTIDKPLSETNTRQYGRDRLVPGVQGNLGILAANRMIPLDGFFIRSSLANGIRLDTSSPCYSDLRWLIEVTDRAGTGVYLDERLFAYQTSTLALTNTTAPLAAHLDQWHSIRKTRAIRPDTKWVVRTRSLFYGLGAAKALIRSFVYELIGKNR